MSSGKPLIALSCSTNFGLPWGGFARPQRYDYIVEGYPDCIQAAGGLPIGMTLCDEATTLGVIDRVDGLILTGGIDIAPVLYGQEMKPGLGEVLYDHDLMEIAAARAAAEKGIPILGVCRGIQLLAVAFGGKLIQDIPSEVKNAINHSQSADKHVLSHKVRLEPGTRLAGIIGAEEIWVNSKHHQAVAEPPEGFLATAHSSDGLIEAMEHPESDFLIGVQWHPEGNCALEESSRRIFEAFVGACSPAA